MLSARHLKWIAIGYLVKTALIGIAWLTVPELPRRAREGLRQGWRHVRALAEAPTDAATPNAAPEPTR